MSEMKIVEDENGKSKLVPVKETFSPARLYELCRDLHAELGKPGPSDAVYMREANLYQAVAEYLGIYETDTSCDHCADIDGCCVGVEPDFCCSGAELNPEIDEPTRIDSLKEIWWRLRVNQGVENTLQRCDYCGEHNYICRIEKKGSGKRSLSCCLKCYLK